MKETFGQRIARLRKEKGLTQNEIAERLNISPQAVSKWENDQSTPDIDCIIKLSEIFNVTLDELMGKKHETVAVQEKPSKKDIDKMFLRVRIQDGKNGDKVNVNLPLAIVKGFIDVETGQIKILNGNKNLEGIDWKQVISMIEQGVVGELVNIESADGDTISIIVE